ncbi:MAG: flagellar hook-basal body complex protein, partial [Caulobacteraceae bacterium]
VIASTRHYTSQGGQLQRTTSGTDLGIAGQGFFVVTEKAENLTPIDARLFTRAGAFTPDDFGFLKNTAGPYLQGWPVDSEGNIATDPSDMNRLQSINIGSVGGAAEATTRAQLNANLQSSQAISPEAAAAALVPPGADAYSPLTNSMAMYDRETGAGVKPDFTMSIPVSDSKGGQRTLAVSFLKADGPNEWYAEIHAIPASDIEGAPNGLIKSGRIVFTQNGRLDPAATAALGADALFTDVNATSLSIGASDAAAAPGAVKWATNLGIAAQPINLALNASAGGLTQYSSVSAVQSVNTNGTAFGNLASIQIDKEGFVTAIFDNSVTRRIAQVAIATFASPDNLTVEGGNAYRVSQGSGTFNLKTAGTGGAGFIGASQLEASTVDLSAEFTGLITTQRAYSASSKIITTADEMLAELISIKR